MSEIGYLLFVIVFDRSVNEYLSKEVSDNILI